MSINIKNPEAHHKGFTLIEVVITVAILGFGLILIIELFSGGLKMAKLSEEYTRAINYARLKMEQLRLNPPIEEATEEGSFDRNYRWRIIYKEVSMISKEVSQDFKAPAKIFKIDLTIFWKSGFRERSIGFETYKTVNEKEIEEKS